MIQPWLRFFVLAALVVGACRAGGGGGPEGGRYEVAPASGGADSGSAVAGDDTPASRPGPSDPDRSGAAGGTAAPAASAVPRGGEAKAPAPRGQGMDDPDMAAIIAAAVALVASESGVDHADVAVVDVTAVTWRDGSLGCPEPGRYYIQQLIDGFRLLLSAAGKQYDVHTDRRPGGNMVICSGGGSTLE